jgi:lysozyme family protein
LIRRRQQTADASACAAIDAATTPLNDTFDLLDQEVLLDAAAAVVEATAALERVVLSARLGPFDDYVAALEGVFGHIAHVLCNGEVGERLDRTPEAVPPPSAVPTPADTMHPARGATVTPSPELPPPSEPIPTAGAAAALPPIGSGRNFAALRAEYDAWFQALTIRPEQQGKVDWHVAQLLKHQARYQPVSLQVNGVPWALVGVIHAMACGFHFTGHLHNGDPFTSRTRHVPAGRPQTGTPPFSWEASAVDALTQEGFSTVTDWSIPHMLYLLEKYNGFGYRNQGLQTPYLWSFSKLYQKGKYTADGCFDPEAVSKQCGAAVMLKALMNRGIALS